MATISESNDNLKKDLDQSVQIVISTTNAINNQLKETEKAYEKAASGVKKFEESLDAVDIQKIENEMNAVEKSAASAYKTIKKEIHNARRAFDKAETFGDGLKAAINAIDKEKIKANISTLHRLTTVMIEDVKAQGNSVYASFENAKGEVLNFQDVLKGFEELEIEKNLQTAWDKISNSTEAAKQQGKDAEKVFKDAISSAGDFWDTLKSGSSPEDISESFDTMVEKINLAKEAYSGIRTTVEGFGDTFGKIKEFLLGPEEPQSLTELATGAAAPGTVGQALLPSGEESMADMAIGAAQPGAVSQALLPIGEEEVPEEGEGGGTEAELQQQKNDEAIAMAQSKEQALTDLEARESEKRKQAKLQEEQLKAQSVAKGFSQIGGMAQKFYESSGKKNKAAFEVMKATRIAETVVNTYSGAMGAFNALSGIPIVGPALGAAAAAAVIAMGMQQVKQIQSMKPGGSASGGGGGTAAVGAAAAGGGGSTPSGGSGETAGGYSYFSYESSKYGTGWRIGEGQEAPPPQQVTYNINAVDSKSFQQMVEENPESINKVVQQDIKDNGETKEVIEEHVVK